MSLEEQRKKVMARHKELVAQRNKINEEIRKNLEFFSGKEAEIKHARGSFEAVIIGVYYDETMTVQNLDSDKKSTRLLHDLKRLFEPDE